MKTPAPDACHVCHLERDAQAAAIIHRDEDWTITTVQEVPGMVMMFTRRHDDGLGAMPPAAAASLGTYIQAIGAELVQSGGFDRVALMHLGDNSRHSHFLFVGRPDGDQPIADTAALQARIPSLRNPEKSEVLAGAIRRKLSGDIAR